MNNLETFESQIEIEHKERVRKDNIKHKLMDIRGENIYIGFCVWCNCQGDTNHKLRGSAKVFANWLKNKKIVLSEYQRRYIANKYFGWEFYWNEKESKWESKKK